MAPARPFWKGYVKFSLVSCPVALYAGTSTTERVSFRRINRQTDNRLRQQLVDKVTRELVGGDDRGRGYEYAKNATWTQAHEPANCSWDKGPLTPAPVIARRKAGVASLSAVTGEAARRLSTSALDWFAACSGAPFHRVPRRLRGILPGQTSLPEVALTEGDGRSRLHSSLI